MGLASCLEGGVAHILSLTRCPYSVFFFDQSHIRNQHSEEDSWSLVQDGRSGGVAGS